MVCLYLSHKTGFGLPYSQLYKIIFSLFLHKNTFCEYSSELPNWGTSDKHMSKNIFLCRSKNSVQHFIRVWRRFQTVITRRPVQLCTALMKSQVCFQGRLSYLPKMLGCLNILLYLFWTLKSPFYCILRSLKTAWWVINSADPLIRCCILQHLIRVYTVW